MNKIFIRFYSRFNKVLYNYIVYNISHYLRIDIVNMQIYSLFAGHCPVIVICTTCK